MSSLHDLHEMPTPRFPCGSVVNNLPAMQETQRVQVPSLSQEDPLEKDRQSTPVFLPGKSHGKRSLVDNSPRDHKELDTTE